MKPDRRAQAPAVPGSPTGYRLALASVALAGAAVLLILGRPWPPQDPAKTAPPAPDLVTLVAGFEWQPVLLWEFSGKEDAGGTPVYRGGEIYLPALRVPPGPIRITFSLEPTSQAPPKVEGARIFWANPAGEFVGDYYAWLTGTSSHLETGPFNPDHRGSTSHNLLIRLDLPPGLEARVKAIEVQRALGLPMEQLSDTEARNAYATVPDHPLTFELTPWGTGAFRTAVGFAGLEEAKGPIAVELVATVMDEGGETLEERSAGVPDASGRFVYRAAWTRFDLDLSRWDGRKLRVRLTVRPRSDGHQLAFPDRMTVLWQTSQPF